MLLPAAGRGTQLFHLTLSEPGKHTFAGPCIYIADIIYDASLAPEIHAHVVLLFGSLPRRHLEAESAAAEIVVFVVAVDAVEVLLEEGADGG